MHIITHVNIVVENYKQASVIDQFETSYLAQAAISAQRKLGDSAHPGD